MYIFVHIYSCMYTYIYVHIEGTETEAKIW